MLGRVLSLTLVLSALSLAAQDGPLIHWTFDEGQGTVVKDVSGNGLDGTMAAQWVDSPSGKAAFLDGQSPHIISVKLPEGKKFGTGSWSFMAWVKPHQLKIDDRQNQRRIFAFGVYPAAYLVIDITGLGNLSCYFCYKDENDKTVSTGGSSALRVKENEWAQVALVCDRENGKLWLYVDGYAGGGARLRDNFAGDFSIGDELTIGNGWHNYWGTLDEVQIYRRALDPKEVRKDFLARRDAFGVKESEEMKAAMQREAIAALFKVISDAWSAGDFATVRKQCARAVALEKAPVHFRSYAQLRLAQSYMATGDRAAARAEYAKIAATADYPEVHRYEARECIKEIDRVAKGLPAHDPMESRTPIAPVTTFAAEVYVGPNGKDGNDGTRARPFASLTQARNAVRAIKAKGVKGPIGVRILPGEYPVIDTLALTAEDSGQEGAPVVYQATEKGKSVFYGGARLTGFAPVTDPAIIQRLPKEGRGKVLQCDLKAKGITEYGELAVRGFGQPPSPPTLELYFDGKPMTLARWPNQGFVGIKSLVDPGNRAKGTPSVIEYSGDRPARWTQANDPWLFGYFRYLWADATLKIAKIDTAAHTITSAEAYKYGSGMDNRQGIHYYAFNLLEEIDEPGEWYLDRASGILYFYPPSAPDQATIEIGMLPVPMITMENVTDVRIEGLDFDLARYNGIVATDCSRILIAGCTVGRMAGNGIMIHGGERDGIVGCDIHTIGRRATEVIGGERETLTPGRHYVENCQIHDFGRIDRTYTPAIQLEGVGNHVAHNLMYDCPSSVMRIEGNDHLIEYNDVHSAVQESDDQGAMELFRNATYRGVVFRYNRFRNVGKTGSESAVHGQAAIRFDDAISGMLVYGNLFVRSANGHFGAIQMNSGRDNLMDNNVFVDCKQGISGGWNAGNNVWRQLREGKQLAGFYTNALYLQRYPKIATMLDEPAYNYIWRNLFAECGSVTTGNPGRLDLFENGVYDTDPGFVDAAHGDYRLKPNSPVFAKIGLRPLPLNEVGLYNDAFRASWPVQTAIVQVPDWRAAKKH
jgi:hypothetical protein